MPNTVLVTGFGPFGEHKVNASWQAVQLLLGYSFEDVDLVIEEIPVTYSIVDLKVPLLWKKYNPKLVIHVGVSSYANKLMIETQAFRAGYSRTDCQGNTHVSGEACCITDGRDCIKTCLDIDKICSFLNEKTDIKAAKSTNAGRYICEYTYYKSLNECPERTIFVHVPPLNKPYTADELAKGLSYVITCALEQISSCAERV